MKTPAERQAAKRQRRKDAGETLVQVWVPADKLEAVKAAIAEAVSERDNPLDAIAPATRDALTSG